MPYVLKIAVERPVYLPLSYRFDRRLKIGVRVRVPLGRSLSKGWVLSVDRGFRKDLKRISEVLDRTPPLPLEFIRFAELISKEYCYPLGLVLKMLFPYDYLSPFGEIGLKASHKPFKKVVVGPREKRSFFYRELISDVLRAGGKALLIVPQVEDLREWKDDLFLKGEVFFWHARMGRKERKLSWEVAKGEGSALFIGTSSASLLPIKDLSLVIVEDEGSSYLRRVSRPYFHARDIILLRNGVEEYSVVLGGALPSAEAYELVRRGWELVELPWTFKPVYRVMDLRKTKTRAFLSLSVFSKVRENLREGRKSVLLLNRKAYASYVKCEECGYVPECPRCGVPLAFYRERGKIRCPYCGYEKPLEIACPNCRGISMRAGSPGIEQVERALKKEFGEVFRWDAETRDFDDRANLIIGTQRVLQYKVMRGVYLACMILADSLVCKPSYRGEEETLRMIYSLADFYPRELYVQTYIPAHPVFKVFKDNSWRDFLEMELKKREELSYPPLSSVALVIAEGKNEPALRKKLEKIKSAFDENGVEVLGPLKRGAEKGRLLLSMLLKGKRGKIQDVIWKLIMEGKLKLTRNLYVIVDPPEV